MGRRRQAVPGLQRHHRPRDRPQHGLPGWTDHHGRGQAAPRVHLPQQPHPSQRLRHPGHRHRIGRAYAQQVFPRRRRREKRDHRKPVRVALPCEQLLFAIARDRGLRRLWTRRLPPERLEPLQARRQRWQGYRGRLRSALRRPGRGRGPGPEPRLREEEERVRSPGLVAAGLLLAALLMPLGVALGAQPEFPRTFVDTTYVGPTGRTLAVAAGGDFQAALDAVQPGDMITLEAGARFVGNFTFPNKTTTGWIVVRTSAADSSLPAPGTRISPSYACVLPKIVSPNSAPALIAAPGAHHYRFVGVEVTVSSDVTMNYGLVLLGNHPASLADVPHDLIFDRVYIHGHPYVNLRRGIALNSAATAVIDSYIADVHELLFDSQAIAGWDGPGPFKIVNNYLEGAAENLLFGGADPSLQGLVPSDIEIRRNHFSKPLSWRVSDPSYAGIHWVVKNLLELKNARRVLIDGNLFENNWQDAQGGTAILFTVRNQDGTAPWSIVADVTFTNNIVRHVGEGIGMHGWDDLHPSQQSARILIRNNLMDDITSATWGGSGRLFNAFYGIVDLVIDHNTGFMDQAIMYAF